MNLRSHQQQFREVCERIRDGAAITKIVCNCGAGSGKSLLPMIAKAILQYRVCWIVPRTSLQLQAEETFQDPALRELCGYGGPGIRKSTNEKNPARGLDGFTTTYQAISLDSGKLEKEFMLHSYCLVIDECSHVSENATVLSKITQLAAACRCLIAMSGTLERHDGKEISFLNYKSCKHEHGETKWLDLESKEDTAVITYGRKEGLQEKALIPLKATFVDARAEWKKGEKTVSVESLKSARGSKASRALFTALRTEYAIQLLDECTADWLKWRFQNPASKLLVVAMMQKDARIFAERLKKQGITCAVAIEDEGTKAAKAIKEFRLNHTPLALISVQMCHEGLDAPAITHIACLTRVRSRPWLEQMVARAMRYDKHAGPWESQRAHVFCPDDHKMREIIAKIEAEQLAVISKSNQQPIPCGAGCDLFGDPIVPVGSAVTKRRSKQLFSCIEESVKAERSYLTTPSEQESFLRETIERHVRTFAAARRIKPSELNGRLKAKFGKSRSEMTFEELRKVRVFVEQSLR